MKKIFYLIFVGCLALTAASCQKTEELSIIPSEAETGVKLSVTANIEESDDTKVQYEFDGGVKVKIKPSWAMGDKIFGWDSKNTQFSFEVTEIKDGVATFGKGGGYAPEDGTVLYAIYYPGKTAEDIVGKNYTVNLNDQRGILNNGAPVIMCATGTVNNGAVHFRFISQTCIVGIYKMQIFENGQAVANKEIKNVTLNNVVTSARFVKGKDAEGKDVLKLEPFSEKGVITATVELITDDAGYINVGVSETDKEDMKPYFAVIPGNSQISVSAKDSDGKNYENLSVVSESLLSTGRYYYIGKILGGIVAKIGENGYTTLKEAFDAANSSKSAVTVKLFADADNTGVGTNDTLTIRNEQTKKVTLDLNGKTVSAPIKCYTDFEVTDSGNNGIITAKGCTISVGDAKKTNPKPSSATFTLNGGTIKATEGDYAIWAEAKNTSIMPNVVVKKGNIQAENGCAARFKYATATFGDATEGEITVESQNGIWTSTKSVVTFNKGNYTSQGRMYHLGDGSCQVTFTGGTFKSGENDNFFTYYKKETDANLMIEGGKFSWAGDGFYKKDQPHSKTRVTGGFFAGDVSDLIPDESEYACVGCTYESGYTHRVTKENIIQVGTEKYSSLDGDKGAIAAINSAGADVTVTLLADLYPSAAIAINNTDGHTTTLDLNGHTIYYNDEGHLEGYDNYRTIRASTPLIVKDGDSNNLGGGIKATHGALRSTGGELKIEGGVFEGDGWAGDEVNGSGVVYSYGNGLEITGGTIKCICGDKEGRAINFTRGCSITGGTIICEGKGFAVRGYYDCNCTIDGEKVFIYSESANARSPLHIAPSTTTPYTQSLDFKNGYVRGSASIINSNSNASISVTGGHFNKSVTAGENCYCVANIITGPDGKQYTHQVVGSETVSFTNADGTSVGDFNYAYQKSKTSTSACTIKLLKNLTLTGTANFNNNNNNLITLDLNGKQLTSFITVSGKMKIDDSSTGGNGALKRPVDSDEKEEVGSNIIINPGASLEFARGTIEGPSLSNSNRMAISVTGNESSSRAGFTMTGGKITNISQEGAVNVKYGDVVVKGGTIETSGNFGRCFVTYEGAKVTVEDGLFTSQSCIWRNWGSDAEMVIKGGEFKTTKNPQTSTQSPSENSGLFWISEDAAKLEISGGLFGVYNDDKYGIIKFASDMSIVTTTITGGSFNKDARDKLPAADGYSWYESFGSDSSLPGYDLKYIVRKTKL